LFNPFQAFPRGGQGKKSLIRIVQGCDVDAHLAHACIKREARAGFQAFFFVLREKGWSFTFQGLMPPTKVRDAG